MLTELETIHDILLMSSGIPEFGTEQRAFEWFGNSKFSDRNSGYNVFGGGGGSFVSAALSLWDIISGGFANGGIAEGGFRAFANGGVANKPTLGMVGEGKYNEAVVPLPDGKSIPVIGGGGNNVTVNVSVDAQGQSSATEASGKGAKELGYMLSQAVQQELVHQQRPGGLLSAY
jgi:phage-related minor tail protein